MSVSVMADVWRLKLDPSEKLVLMRLADYANADGENAFPSVRTIATDCCMSERNVQIILGKLKKRGVLVQTARATRYRPTIYRVNPEAGDQLPDTRKNRGEAGCTPEDPIKGEADCTPAPSTEAARGETRCTPEPIRGEADFGSGVKPVAPDPPRDPNTKIKTPSAADAPRGADPLPAPSTETKTAPAAPTAPRPIQSELLDEFDALHRAEFKDPATGAPIPLHITRGKDAKNLLELVRKDGADVVRARWRAFLKIRGDRYLESNGYTVSTFLLRYAGLAVRAARRPAGQQAPTGRPSKFAHLTQQG